MMPAPMAGLQCEKRWTHKPTHSANGFKGSALSTTRGAGLSPDPAGLSQHWPDAAAYAPRGINLDALKCMRTIVTESTGPAGETQHHTPTSDPDVSPNSRCRPDASKLSEPAGRRIATSHGRSTDHPHRVSERSQQEATASQAGFTPSVHRPRRSHHHSSVTAPNVPPNSHCRLDAFKLGIQSCGTPRND